MNTPDPASHHLTRGREIAVLLPCLDEEATIGKVVADFRAALPEATVYVFDNNSTDRTADVAREAGAHVVSSPKPGKGNVIQHMLGFFKKNLDTHDKSEISQLLAQYRQGQLPRIVLITMLRHYLRKFPSKYIHNQSYLNFCYSDV